MASAAQFQQCKFAVVEFTVDIFTSTTMMQAYRKLNYNVFTERRGAGEFRRPAVGPLLTRYSLIYLSLRIN